jgi:DNA-binding NtrC family response regulator
MRPSTVLVVDDDANIRNSIRHCLEAEGYEVAQAINGADALEQIQRHPPDVVLLDLAMAGMDGMTVLAELHTLWPKCPTRVIVITAHGSNKVAIEAMRLGADDYLEKPFVPAHIRRSVSKVLRERPTNQADAATDYERT